MKRRSAAEKIADIFRARQSKRSVIVLRPDLLDADGQRGYYNTMAGPIKRHVTKANGQLKQSAETLGSDTVRVLLLINNGYATLSHDEFKDLAIRRACNDTHNIDAVVIAGLYLYSDTFDSYFFPMMDLFPLHIDRPFASYEHLFTEWVKFGQNLLTRSCIFGEDDDHKASTIAGARAYLRTGWSNVHQAGTKDGRAVRVFQERAPPTELHWN